MRTTIITIIAFVTAVSVSFAQQEVKSSEIIHVKESNLYWMTDIDPDSEHSYINAHRIYIMNEAKEHERNIGKEVSFKVINEKDEYKTINNRIAGVVEIDGEKKYTVALNIGYQREYKEVPLVLHDRSDEEFKLVLGQNWIGDEFEVVE